MLVIGGSLYAPAPAPSASTAPTHSTSARRSTRSSSARSSRRPTRWRRSRSWARSASSRSCRRAILRNSQLFDGRPPSQVRDRLRRVGPQRRGGDRLVSIVQALGDQPGGFTQPSHYAVGIGRFLLVCLGSLAIRRRRLRRLRPPPRLLRRDLRHRLLRSRPHLPLRIRLLRRRRPPAARALSLFVAGVLESHYHVYSLSDPAAATAIALKSLTPSRRRFSRTLVSTSSRPSTGGGGGAGGCGGRRRGERLRDRRRHRRRCRCPSARATPSIRTPTLTARPRC